MESKVRCYRCGFEVDAANSAALLVHVCAADRVPVYGQPKSDIVREPVIEWSLDDMPEIDPSFLTKFFAERGLKIDPETGDVVRVSDALVAEFVRLARNGIGVLFDEGFDDEARAIMLLLFHK